MTSFYPDIRTKTYAPKDDDCFAFVPFCCQQQLKGGLPRVALSSCARSKMLNRCHSMTKSGISGG